MTKASVVIAAYNAQAYIADAIASAQAQTMADVEIVIVDDASTDATARIVTEMAGADPRIRLLRQAGNQGPSAARNRAIDDARGEWIAILDADDRFEASRLATLLALAERHRLDMVSDNLLLVPAAYPADAAPMIPDAILAEPRKLSLDEFVRRNVRDPKHPRCNYGFLKPIIRREFLDEHAIRYDENVRFAEDFALYVDCLRHGADWWLAREPLYRYTVRDGSLTHVQTVADLGRLRMRQRRLLADCSGDRELSRVVRRHIRVVDRSFYYRAFTDAIKQGRPKEAAATLTASLTSGWLIVAESARQLPIILQKAWNGGYRKSSVDLESQGETKPAN